MKREHFIPKTDLKIIADDEKFSFRHWLWDRDIDVEMYGFVQFIRMHWN